MPLSFVAIMGGTVTLIGTATNLVVHGEAIARGYDELTMFSIAPVGLICLAVGMLYLFTIGRNQMPRRERPAGPVQPLRRAQVHDRAEGREGFSRGGVDRSPSCAGESGSTS